MMNTSSGKFESRNITIRVDNQRLSLEIPRTEIAEQKIRRAADQVNSTLERYRLVFPEATKLELMTFVALHIANEAQGTIIEQEELQLSSRLQVLLTQLDQIV